ncbi:hypothetical protein JIG36_02085 [Actinoplanes sp. LDG1-06]|uniref:Novel STAND NTPase 1 domain-containing protein n=1 Tax=Paractinoplanes ovalisporus TaxID=2810368 RepID=A0ABS2A3S5_9ACTN|nr:hypothetical protein [Actinoplanes ovalisporus]MBM2614345.1 hypothetical protein [Actinoplanes ovalisporus]
MTGPERSVDLTATAHDQAKIYQAARDLHLHYEEGLREIRRTARPDDDGVPCPYPGLAPFGPGQAQWFFGRDAVTAGLLARLDESLRDGRPIAVVAPSGAGKSSVLNAGLIPAIAQGLLPEPGSAEWPRIVLTPTAHPMRVLPAVTGHERAVVIVDQLEELFTLCPDEQERHEFLDALAALPRGVLLVLGMRSDFYTQGASHPWLRDVLQHDQVLLGPMSEPELREAIRLPLRAPGVELEMEPGLLELLLKDLGGDGSADVYRAGRLPLLAHALRACWQQRSGHTLTVAGYRATGGIANAVATTAERVYQRLDDTERVAARSMFLRLVKIGAGVEDTRRRLPRADVEGPGLEAFATNRLLTLHRDTVEITHEALLTAWPRLRSWIDEDRDGLLVHQHLEEDAGEWRRGGRDAGLLYRGLRLESARQWQATHPGETTDAEREFVRAGIALRTRGTRRLKAVAAVLAVLLISAVTGVVVALDQRGAARSQSAVNLSRQIALQSDAVREVDADLAILLAAESLRRADTLEARASAVAATNQQLLARIDTGQGEIRSMAYLPGGTSVAAAGSGQVKVWDLGTRRATATLEHPGGGATSVVSGPGGPITAGRDGRVYLWDGARATPLTGHGGEVTGLALAGRLLASSGNDGTVRLWDLTTRKPVRTLQAGGPLTAVAISPDGRTVAAGGPGRRLRLWEAGTGRQLAALSRDPADGMCGRVTDYTITSLSFHPDGRTLLSGDGAACVFTVWDVVRRTSKVWVSGHTWDVHQVAYSPDGSQVATTSRDGTVRLWNAANWWQLERRTGHTGIVLGLAWAPDGHTLLSGGDDQMIRLWRTPALTGHTDSVNGISWSTDGRRLASASRDRTARIWNVATGRVEHVLRGHTAGLGDVEFGPRGNLLVTASVDGTVRLWDATTFAARGILKTGNSAWAFGSFSPDGQLLATSGPGGNPLVWDLTTREVRWRAEGHPQGAYRAVFSPDGKLLATGGADNLIRVFDVASARPLRVVRGHISPVVDLLFTPDGRHLVSTGGDRYLRVWDTTTWEPAGILRGHLGRVEDLAISPDGRRLASGGVRGEVKTWDVATQTLLTNFEFQHRDAVYGVAFSPDGRTLASASGDASIRLAPVDFDETAAGARLCGLLNRDLTPGEWRQYLPGQPYARTCTSG